MCLEPKVVDSGIHVHDVQPVCLGFKLPRPGIDDTLYMASIITGHIMMKDGQAGMLLRSTQIDFIIPQAQNLFISQ